MLDPLSINPESLNAMPFKQRSNLPQKAGVYLCIDEINEEVYYIGQTKNLRRRLVSHNKNMQFKQIKNLRIAYVFLDVEKLQDFEKALIKRFNPLFNRDHTSRRRSKLKRKSVSYISIEKWYPEDDKGKKVSINSIYKGLKGTKNEIDRYTLTKARNGQLEKADISTLEALVRICSTWAGTKLCLEDLIISSTPKAIKNKRNLSKHKFKTGVLNQKTEYNLLKERNFIKYFMDVVYKKTVEGLSERLREARVKDGRSVQVLATDAGISINYWYQLETDKREWVSEQIVRRIEKVLGVDLGLNFKTPIAA